MLDSGQVSAGKFGPGGHSCHTDIPGRFRSPERSGQQFARRNIQGGQTMLHTQPFHRREFLRVGGLSLLGLSLPGLFRAECSASSYAVVTPRARAKSCIFLFLTGGPSQFETFDPKPDAKSDIRTIFGTIATNVPGTFLCAHLP